MKSIYISFITLFLAVLILPAVFAHTEVDRVADMENRYYANVPQVVTEEGSVNTSFNTDFDNWISDNVRGRELVMMLNARIQYALFGRIIKDDTKANESNGDLFFVQADKVRTYQHLDLLDDEELSRYAGGLKNISDWLSAQGIGFYYMQCYDKETVYPELYFSSVNQYGEIGRGRQVYNAVKEAGVNTIDMRSVLMDNKDQDRLYYKVTDPGHWNLKGAWLGYQEMIRTFQEDYDNIPDVNVDDYEITRNHDHANLFGMIYPVEEDSDDYFRISPMATEIQVEEAFPELAGTLHYTEHNHYFVNDTVPNDLKILTINDSYIRMYIKDQLAEHFAQTMSLDALNEQELQKIVEVYKPDIVVIECAEAYYAMNQARPLIEAYAEGMKEQEK